MADHGTREVDEPLDDPAVRHEFAGEEEERNGQQQELVRARAELLRDDDERYGAVPDEIADRGRQHRVGDRNVQREEQREAAEDRPQHR